MGKREIFLGSIILFFNFFRYFGDSPAADWKQQRKSREAVCEERAGAAAGAGAKRQAGGVILTTG